MDGSRLLIRSEQGIFRIPQRERQGAPRLKGLSFESMDELVLWCCNHRRFLEYLIGRRYMTEKKPLGSTTFRGNQYTGPIGGPNANDGHTAENIADELGVSANSIKRAEAFVAGLDAAEKIVPGITFEILSGMITPSKKAVITVGREKDPKRKTELTLALLESPPVPDDEL